MEDSLPIALRRTRRSSTAPTEEPLPSPSDEQPQIAASPRTPRRAHKKKGTKKAVRFSDPASSGLTPFFRRAALATTPRRRSTPALSPSRPAALTPPCGTGVSPRGAGVASRGQCGGSSPVLHQTVDGRIERRTRRNGLRDLLNKLDFQKRKEKQSAQTQILQLKADLKHRDEEIYELQNATMVLDTDRIWELERQVGRLEGELRQREAEQKRLMQLESSVNVSHGRNDAIAPSFDYGDDDDVGNDAFLFGDDTARNFLCSTPTRSSRARESFPTPPATSPTIPTMPNTPTRVVGLGLGKLTANAGVQTSFRDEGEDEKDMLQDEVDSLRIEADKLKATLLRFEDLGVELSEKMRPYLQTSPETSSTSSGVELLKQQVGQLVTYVSDRCSALNTVNDSLLGLGFPGSDAAEVLASLTASFRTARLELEYLTPGEIALPLTCHGAEVLELLVSRLRELSSRVKADEQAIDEYHEIESSLRKQLDARVQVIDDLKAQMETLATQKKASEQTEADLRVGNERLRGAVEGYIRDVNELERLVEQLERQGRDATATLDATKESHRQALKQLQTGTIADLQDKMRAATSRAEQLEEDIATLGKAHAAKVADLHETHEKQVSSLQDSQTAHVVKLNKAHGKALALRDARVVELREEIERMGASVREAYDRVLGTGRDKSALERQKRALVKENEEWKVVVEREREKSKVFLEKVMMLGGGMLDGERTKRVRGEPDDEEEKEAETRAKHQLGKGEYLGAQLAKRSSKRRKYDSGVGMMEGEEEEEVEMF